MKVFYSWQSDTPNNVGRAFIRKTLDAAVSSLQVDEAERPLVDQDTAGVLGSPVVANTIFEKIREAKIVVADVTLTGRTPEDKRLLNSNVAIEVGYALGVQGDHVLLTVMNTHYGTPDDLPFDLKHRRWPVQFSLSPDAGGPERQRERDVLSRNLGNITEAYIEANRPPKETFASTSSTLNSATYWQPDEDLIPARRYSGGGTKPVRYPAGQALMYLRIWPQEKIRPIAVETLSDYSKSAIEPLAGGINGWSTDRNKYGLLTYATFGEERALGSTTQVFRNGEIWGVNAYRLRTRPEFPNFPKLVPTQSYESGLRESLRRYLDAARSYFGYPSKITVESGLVNVKDFMLALPDEVHGPIFEDVKISTTVNLDEPESVTEALLKIFKAVFEAAGTIRPAQLYNFPPPKS
jgi:hypothetical protein